MEEVFQDKDTEIIFCYWFHCSTHYKSNWEGLELFKVMCEEGFLVKYTGTLK